MSLATLAFALLVVVHPRGPGAISKCTGTPADGSLSGAVSLPHHGANFSSYSTVGWLLGRQHVHSSVYATLVEAQQDLARHYPDQHTVFGETGWPWGGSFPPHRTHRNGTSVDVMVPVRRADATAAFPSSLLNKFGYGIEFDHDGQWRDYRIDYDAIVTQLFAIDRAAHRNGIAIDLVIFDNTLQQQLWQARDGQRLRQRVRFSQTPAWVRHDEHFHINFAVDCGR